MKTDRPASRRYAAIVTVGLSLSGVVTVMLATRKGIGTSVDSAAYLQAASALASGTGEVSLVQHAPLYSLLLAAAGLAGLDPMAGARWLNALAFGSNIGLVGVLIRRFVAERPWLAPAGAGLALALAPMVEMHVMALSEAVFLTCTLAGFWLLARYIDHPTALRLVAAALVLGLALTARYAGAAALMTGILAIIGFVPGSWRTRVHDAVLFCGVAAAPIGGWISRNLILASSATGREVAFHPVGMTHAWQALYTMSGWLLIPPSAPNAIRLGAWLLVGLVCAAVVAQRIKAATPVPAIVRVLVLFLPTYCAFLAASISSVDANTPLDNRILLPVLAVSIVLLAYGFDTLAPLARRVPPLAHVGIITLVLLVGGHGLKSANAVAAGYEKGWGFNGEVWRESPTLRQVAAIGAETVIFSNAPEIVYLRTGRLARSLPRARFLMSQRTNPDVRRQLDEVAREVRVGCAVVVYLRNLNQKSMYTEVEFAEALALEVLIDADDGIVWGVTTCRR